MGFLITPLGHPSTAEGQRSVEIASIVFSACKEAGYSVSLENGEQGGAYRRIVVGMHLASKEYLKTLPTKSILLNHVPLAKSDKFLHELAEERTNLVVWDPSPSNRALLQQFGIEVIDYRRCFVEDQARLYWHSLSRVNDVLIVGSDYSRAFAIAHELRQYGLQAVVSEAGNSPMYREQLLASTKLVLDLPAPAERVSFLAHDRAIMNLIPVIAAWGDRDLSPDWREAMMIVSPESAVDTCIRLLDNHKLLRELAHAEFALLGTQDEWQEVFCF